MQSQDLLSYLRSETRPQHERLESRLDLSARLQGPEAYTALLLRFRGIYAPLESRLNRLADAGSLPIVWEPRRKLPFIDADLDALGVTVEQRKAAPIDKNSPYPENTADAMGCLYVLEGSTLGGQVIIREIIGNRPALQSVQELGAIHFFSSYGRETGKCWREFCDTLNAWGQNATDVERKRCAESAGATFAAFDRWLTGADNG